ncbi:bidirectional formate transporter [Fervidicella metallireducens AeB]|uniref:Bidirectional formate transporter n=1 Tax=Fervidicella metallireducens AeB TaxID=1403537 RepID=A0A017RXQ9_9CLOT|nr:formate/nitrite transporter family protein [Fervidicella metallireducens]EYE89189.1 bidirectional formate transporter [Fervidicella metallireducens AeB]
MDKRILTSAEICEEGINVGIKKTKSFSTQTLILSILAGVFISLGAFTASTASHNIENYGVAKLVSGAIFPVGLILVIICGGELFTGNTLMVAALSDKKITISKMLKNWVIVYIGNFIGSFIIAFLIFNTGLLDANSGKLGGYVLKIASTKSSLSFRQAFSSGILCNILVSVAVWASYAARDVVGKIFAIWFPVMAFIVSGFEHSIANMYYFTIALLAKNNINYIKMSHITAEKLAKIDITHAINNIIPVTLGNIIGGSIIIALSYWTVYKRFPDKVLIKREISGC